MNVKGWFSVLRGAVKQNLGGRIGQTFYSVLKIMSGLWVDIINYALGPGGCSRTNCVASNFKSETADDRSNFRPTSV